MKLKKGQTGLDVLVTYGWIFVVGAGAIVILSQMGVFSPGECPKARTGFSQVIPVDWAVYRGSNMVVVDLENWMGDAVEITQVTILLGDLECTQEFASFLDPGQKAVHVISCPDSVISAGYNLGDCYTADVYIAYSNTVTGNSYESRGRFEGPVEEGVVTTSTSTTSTTTTITTTTTTTTTTSTSTTTTTTTTTTSTSTTTTTTTTTTSTSTTTTTTTTSTSTSTTTTTTTTTSTSTTTTSSTTTSMCGVDADCGFCKKCVSGSCVNQASGEDRKNECPGSLGTCAGSSCNGAGNCQYLSGKQGCGTCQYCTGSSYSCSYVASGSDTYGECPGSLGVCAGSSCNGAGACQYLSVGKQGCGTCQYCSGGSYSCVNVAADSDTYGDCSGNCDECNGAGACRGDNTRCSGTASSCYCSGSGTVFNCQTCPDTYGVCGTPTCSAYSCGNVFAAAGTDCGGFCQSCNGAGSCVNTASGSDYQNECPGSLGTCAGSSCNGAGNCQYLSGNQGCGTCKYCTGSSFSCANVASGTDPYGACAESWTGCSGSCTRTGADGNCNGAGACNTAASSCCPQDTVCSSGSCTSGACNSEWHCSGTSNCQYTCNGAGSCSTDYNCDSCTDCSCSCGGYNVDESYDNDNCGDGIDNDCDGNTDSEDSGCGPCACSGTGYETKTLSGDTVYVDCNADKCWTPSAGGTRTWGPYGVNEPDDSCIGKGSSYPACNYCDNLDYGGFSDWTLPVLTVLQNLCFSDSCSGTCFGGDGWPGRYWSSSESSKDLAWYVTFGGAVDDDLKGRDWSVRCVRG